MSKNSYKIYLAHPMSGLSWEEVEKYYTKARKILGKMGYTILHPMIAKKELSGTIFNPAGEDNSFVITPHAITRRDYWMVRQSDIIFVDLSNVKEKSIGCISEVAVGYNCGKHVIGIMEKDNIHRHAFMSEQLDITFETYCQAIKYLQKLIKGAY